MVGRGLGRHQDCDGGRRLLRVGMAVIPSTHFRHLVPSWPGGRELVPGLWEGELEAPGSPQPVTQ